MTNPVEQPQQQIASLGGRLKEARKNAGLSIRDAAAQAGVHRTTIEKAEGDRAPLGWPQIWKLARVYDCDPQTLEPRLRSVPSWLDWVEPDEPCDGNSNSNTEAPSPPHPS